MKKNTFYTAGTSLFLGVFLSLSLQTSSASPLLSQVAQNTPLSQSATTAPLLPTQVGQAFLPLTLTLDLVTQTVNQLITQGVPDSTPETGPAPAPELDSAPLGMEYRAMWISYLELMTRDLSTKDKFIREISTMFSQCESMGVNRVIVQVRPFGDALYPSSVYPWSHLITGTQGKDPGFDPLAEMITLAKQENLQIEAWVNPYRARLNSQIPGNFSADNPANQPGYTFSVGGGVYYNPALLEVQALVVEGIVELVEGYDLDGIHLDDYFYPTTDFGVDEAQYLASGTTLSQEDWRRENVNTLVKSIYSAIKASDSSVDFGISPQGNNDNNYNTQYSDVNLWLSTPGYVDYITPQLYWGFNHTTASGRTDFAFQTIANTWNQYPRHPDVSLYVGLAAYRIGDGDGSETTQEEWLSGRNLADMMLALSAMDGVDGYTLFRHDFLFQNSNYPLLSQKEVAAIAALHS